MASRLSPSGTRWIALLWAAGVAASLLAPTANLPEPPGWLPAAIAPVFDKVLHLLLFGLTTWIFHRALGAGRRRGSLAAAVLLAVTYGLLLEGLQAWVPGREQSLGDALANLAGASLYASVAVIPPLARVRERLRPPRMR